MLGKLIKYDMKRQMKGMAGAYVVALIISVMAAIMHSLAKEYTVFALVEKITWGLSIFACIVIFVATVFYVILYFRKSFFKDEGYLMHTLPVTKEQLFGSKLLTGCIISIFVAIWAYLCYGISVLDLAWGSKLVKIMKDVGVSNGVFFVIGAFVLLAIIVNLCYFYASICIGYTWQQNTITSTNRDILSVVAYIIIYMIQQIVSVVALLVYFLITYHTLDLNKMMTAGFSDTQDVMSYLYGVFGMSAGLQIVSGIVFVFIIINRLNNHLNLE